MIRIRHYLTEALADGSGHIGQYIAPKWRSKGFGKKMLRLAITYTYIRITKRTGYTGICHADCLRRSL
ncbi:MAG: hypothetical protein KBT21_05915 [Treponema sp.]|nr:hypothetical protein [Candidatus Treponema merdequi]